jgi:hypothetical protein
MSREALALQKAIITTVEAEVSTPIYDAVPQGTGYPYITYNQSTVSEDDFLDDRLDQVSVSLNVWSRRRGQQEVLEIMADLDDSLHLRKLALDDGQLVSLRVTAKRTNREPDNETFMGQLTLLAHIHH